MSSLQNWILLVVFVPLTAYVWLLDTHYTQVRPPKPKKSARKKTTPKKPEKKPKEEKLPLY